MKTIDMLLGCKDEAFVTGSLDLRRGLSVGTVEQVFGVPYGVLELSDRRQCSF
jgi:hypothetical protein